MSTFEFTCEKCDAHVVTDCDPSRPEHAEVWLCLPCFAEACGDPPPCSDPGECDFCGAPYELCGCYRNEGE